MDTLATPYLRINKLLLSIIGQWPYQPRVTKCCCYLMMLFFSISQTYLQIGGMIGAYLANDMDVFLESIPTVLADFTCFAKVFNFTYNSDKMKKLLLTLEDDWRKFQHSPELEILHKYATIGKNSTLLYVGTLYGTMTPFLFMPLIPLVYNLVAPDNANMPKQLMFQQIKYFMDTDKYYYPLLLHGSCSSIILLTLVVSIDAMYMVYVQHACAAFSIVRSSLESVATDDNLDFDLYPLASEDKGFIDMGQCVVKHNHALDYAKLIDTANTVSYFVQIGINMICISFTGFQIVMKMDDEKDVAFRFATFTISQILVLFLLSWPAQQLHDHSVQIGESVNNAGWYRTSMRTRKLFQVMTIRTRMPCEVSAGKFYVLNLASFSMVVRSSMSYITVLMSMK